MSYQRALFSQGINDTLKTLALLAKDGRRRSKKTWAETRATFEGLEAVLAQWEECYGALPADAQIAYDELKAQYIGRHITRTRVHSLRKALESVLLQKAEVEIYPSTNMIKIGGQLYQGLLLEQTCILASLMRHPDAWCTTSMMIEEYPVLGNRKTIERALKSLCEDLRRLVQSKRGAGYRLVTPRISMA